MTARPATVTLYRRRECPLCDQARQLLASLAGELGFRVDEVDIEQNDDLHRRFMLEIPVVALDGEVVAQAPLREAALRTRLGEALARHAATPDR